MENEFKNYDWKEGMGAAVYAILGITFLIGTGFGVVITLICK